MEQKAVSIGNIEISNLNKAVLIAGPCVIESVDHAVFMAKALSKIAGNLGVPYIFKSSVRKANRSSHESFTGIPPLDAIDALETIRFDLKIPVLTDVHNKEDVRIYCHYADVLQIPAFLCRQTELLEEAAQSTCVVNVKKGQFLSPWEMENIVHKLEYFGTEQILLTERGTCFGYNTLVNDFRGIEIMKRFGYPVIFDATHSVQMPGAGGDKSGGESQYAPVLARAAAAVGVAGFFIETHDKPSEALSDGPNMVPLDKMHNLTNILRKIDGTMKFMGVK